MRLFVGADRPTATYAVNHSHSEHEAPSTRWAAAAAVLSLAGGGRVDLRPGSLADQTSIVSRISRPPMPSNWSYNVAGQISVRDRLTYCCRPRSRRIERQTFAAAAAAAAVSSLSGQSLRPLRAVKSSLPVNMVHGMLHGRPKVLVVGC